MVCNPLFYYSYLGSIDGFLKSAAAGFVLSSWLIFDDGLLDFRDWADSLFGGVEPIYLSVIRLGSLIGLYYLMLDFKVFSLLSG